MQPRRDFIFFALFAAFLLVIAYRANLFEGRHFYATDVTTQQTPDRFHFAQEIRSGHFPLWTNQIFCGYPLFAEGQSGVLYPFFLIFVAIHDVYFAYDAFIIFHFWLGAVLFYLYLRARKVGPLAAAFSGCSILFSSLFISFHVYPNHLSTLVWIPAYLCCLENYRRAENMLWLLLGSLVIVVQILTGHPQFLCIGLFLAFLLNLKRVPLFLRFVLFSLTLGVATAAVQFVPFAEFLSHSQRANGLGINEITRLSFSPKIFLQMILPRHFGVLNDQTYRLMENDPEESLLLYVGIALPVALIGCLRRPRYFLTEILILLLGCALVIGKYFHPVILLYAHKPFSFFRYPGRFSYLIVFAILVIAAEELNLFLSRFKRDRSLVFGSIAIAAALISVLRFGLPLPPVAVPAALPHYSLDLAPMQRIVSNYDALIPDKFTDPIQPLSKKYEVFRQILGGDQNTFLGAWNAKGIYHSFIARSYFERFQYGEFSYEDTSYLDLTNTAFLLSPFAFTSSAWTFLKKEGNVWIYNRKPAYSGAWWRGSNATGITPCDVKEASEEEMHFQCSSATTGTVTISMTNYPGWKAEVNGRSVPIHTEYGFLMSVTAPAGINDIVLKYRPVSFRIGVILSILGCMCFGVLIVIHARHQRTTLK